MGAPVFTGIMLFPLFYYIKVGLPGKKRAWLGEEGARKGDVRRNAKRMALALAASSRGECCMCCTRCLPACSAPPPLQSQF